jgi:hypothetical protein
MTVPVCCNNCFNDLCRFYPDRKKSMSQTTAYCTMQTAGIVVSETGCKKFVNPKPDNTYSIELYHEIVNRKPWRKLTPEEDRVYHLRWHYCPDGTPHDFKVKADESYMCDTMYMCTKCGHKMRQDSSD